MGKEDDKLLDDLLASELKVEDDDPAGKLPTVEDIAALQEQLDEANKEKHGLLQSVKAERQKRQELSGRLSQLTDTVNTILETKQNAPAPQPSADPTQSTPSVGGIPVTFTEDGEGFIDPKQLNEWASPYQQRINELEQQLQLTSNTHNAEAEAEKVKASIIGEDERYHLANSKYQAARKWATDRVMDFIQTQGINRQLSSGEALDYVFDKATQDEFKAQFPELNPVDIITAEDSQHHFRTMLNNVADAMTPVTPEPVAEPNANMDSRFQKVLNKPSGLGNAANAQAGALSITEKVGNLAVDDILNLTDTQIQALEAAMSKEEKTDGVKF
jgi:hypothetical protein